MRPRHEYTSYSCSLEKFETPPHHALAKFTRMHATCFSFVIETRDWKTAKIFDRKKKKTHKRTGNESTASITRYAASNARNFEGRKAKRNTGIDILDHTYSHIHFDPYSHRVFSATAQFCPRCGTRKTRQAFKLGIKAWDLSLNARGARSSEFFKAAALRSRGEAKLDFNNAARLGWLTLRGLRRRLPVKTLNVIPIVASRRISVFVG